MKKYRTLKDWDDEYKEYMKGKIPLPNSMIGKHTKTEESRDGLMFEEKTEFKCPKCWARVGSRGELCQYCVSNRGRRN